MTVERMTLRFVGEHESMGYRKGAFYKLSVRRANWKERLFKGWNLVIWRYLDPHGKGYCPYSSKEVFEANWSNK